MTITISENHRREEEIKKSRFICQLARVQTEEEAQDFVQAMKKLHPKANHNCWTYVLGDHQEVQRMSDDGEPSGTAGVPMLEVLKKWELTNVVAVVTRYFGGIKLGAGGLIRAYAGSLAHALDEVGLVAYVPQRELYISLDYGLYDSLQRFLAERELVIQEAEFLEAVKVKLYVDEAVVPDLEAELTEQFQAKLSISKGEELIAEIPYKRELEGS
ncbi:YigZ family protein [Lactococcus termiticola]|uniref:YigZ family protein n=1 Tax=Lactococcus termiticola TaxID=2169526 RepID=A0A2R5HJG9_9LACT|nr:YigZ family protein [Lactococcus termiticola]GBG96401.1 YigZ family protein [Lactococcus termiticola]